MTQKRKADDGTEPKSGVGATTDEKSGSSIPSSLKDTLKRAGGAPPPLPGNSKVSVSTPSSALGSPTSTGKNDVSAEKQAQLSFDKEEAPVGRTRELAARGCRTAARNAGTGASEQTAERGAPPPLRFPGSRRAAAQAAGGEPIALRPASPSAAQDARATLRAADGLGPTQIAPQPLTAAPPPSAGTSPAGDSAEHLSRKPASDGAVSEARRTAKRRAAGPARTRLAANDDTASIGGLIYALNQKPSNRPFHIAALASAVWLSLGLAFAYIILAPEIAATDGGFVDLIRRTKFLTTFATLAGPIGLFWFLAFLTWRSDELRMRSSAMTEVAVRLAEPDRMAEQQVASLGDAVRRQINFMNDAVTLALGRAGELESMVQGEVAALERSYEENERKIRGLLQELASERNSLTGTGEHFQRTLQQLAMDVPKLIESLSTQQGRLAGIVASAGENLTALEASLTRQTDRLESAIDGRADRFTQVFNQRREELEALFSEQNTQLDSALTSHASSMNQTLGTYTEALSQILDQRTQSVNAELDRRMAEIDQKIGKRTEMLQAVFEEYAMALDTTLANRATALDKQLVERTKSLDDAFTERLRLFDEAIVKSTAAIDNAVGQNARALTAAMEQHAEALSESISKQAVELDQTLMQGIGEVRRTSENISRQSIRAIEGLANQADMLKSVSENLLSQINSVTSRFEAQGQTIVRSANALESANYKIDKALSQRTQELNETLDRMVGKADELGRAVQDYSTRLEGSVNEAGERTRLLTEELAREARERSKATVDEFTRITSEASREKDKALEDLKAEFSAVAREVTERLGVLSEQFANTSGEVRARARKAADEIRSDQDRLRAQLDQLPVATRENTNAMRRALQDQLRALDRLTALASKTGAHLDATPARQLPYSQGRREQPGADDSEPANRSRRFSNLTTTLARELSQRTARNQTQTEPQAAPPADEVQKPAASRGSGWSVGDLLARASLDEERAPVSKGNPLDVKTIAGALDANLAGAIWSRFRSGQRGFMVKSIYPQHARQVFDETAERYQKEPAFRANVDQFLDQFETHLRDADARDPSGRAAQQEVVSDAGRVYLFLAHATQRLM